jgi:hypothetical protein
MGFRLSIRRNCRPYSRDPQLIQGEPNGHQDLHLEVRPVRSTHDRNHRRLLGSLGDRSLPANPLRPLQADEPLTGALGFAFAKFTRAIVRPQLWRNEHEYTDHCRPDHHLIPELHRLGYHPYCRTGGRQENADSAGRSEDQDEQDRQQPQVRSSNLGVLSSSP